MNNPVIQVATLLLSSVVLLIIVKLFVELTERYWVLYIFPKPLFRHLYLKKRKLNSDQVYILESEFSFYQRLNRKEKLYFQHRLANLMDGIDFQGKSGVYIDDKKRILTTATAVLLTFGYRDYKLKLVSRILIYPNSFYSTINKNQHKGEFNPAYKAIIFSWEDFLQGYDIANDNFNLGIHEFVHAMHFEYLNPKNDSTSALLFMTHYHKLMSFLKKNQQYRDNLVASKYLRNYAFTNKFEFIAVLIESFIETPAELKQQFPEMYNSIKKMLNFDFAGY